MSDTEPEVEETVTVSETISETRTGTEVVQERHDAVQAQGFLGNNQGGTAYGPGENSDGSAVAGPSGLHEVTTGADVPKPEGEEPVPEAPSDPQAVSEADPAPAAPEAESDAVATLSDGTPAFPEADTEPTTGAPDPEATPSA